MNYIKFVWSTIFVTHMSRKDGLFGQVFLAYSYHKYIDYHILSLSLYIILFLLQSLKFPCISYIWTFDNMIHHIGILQVFDKMIVMHVMR